MTNQGRYDGEDHLLGDGHQVVVRQSSLCRVLLVFELFAFILWHSDGIAMIPQKVTTWETNILLPWLNKSTTVVQFD